MFSNQKDTIFAKMSKPHDRSIGMVSEKSGKAKKDDDCKPARSLNIIEAHNGFVLRGPNDEDKGAVCETKAALLAAVDAAFPDEPGSKAKKSDKEEKAS